MSLPKVDDFSRIIETLDSWQEDHSPMQLHTGDIGWYSMRGPEATAKAIRIWSDQEKILAIGFRDGTQLLRMAFSPEASKDRNLAEMIAADLTDPQRGILDSGEAAVEARGAEALSAVLHQQGWHSGELWTPLARDLILPISPPAIRVERIKTQHVADWTKVHWSAFRGTELSEADHGTFIERFITMTQSPFYAQAQSLLAYDDANQAVAIATIWSAGLNRPGLLEPIGVHREHHRRGYGTAIITAAASALQDMGASSAIVCTQTANEAAVSTYVGAGFKAQHPVADLQREA